MTEERRAAPAGTARLHCSADEAQPQTGQLRVSYAKRQFSVWGTMPQVYGHEGEQVLPITVGAWRRHGAALAGLPDVER